MTKSTIMRGRGSEVLATASLAALLGACGSAPKPEVKTAAPTRPKVKTAADYAADAASALEAGNYAAAVKAYDAVLARDAANGDVLYNRAYALHQLGDLDAAQAAYEQTLEADPGSVDAAINLGAILKEKGELGRAIEVTERALEAEPFNGRLLNNLSVLHREKGNYEEAVAAVRKLLMRDKNNVDAYKNLALIYYAQDKLKMSQTILENARRMSEEQERNDPDIYVNLGMVYLGREDNGRAMAAFKKALELDPKHVEANYNIGALALAHRDYDLAAKSYEVVSDAMPNSAEVAASLGFAYQGQQKLAEAIAQLERAWELQKKAGKTGEDDQVLYQLRTRRSSRRPRPMPRRTCSGTASAAPTKTSTASAAATTASR